jgi:YD repeat-containing protein
VISDSISGLTALAYTYDTRGRLATASQGARSTTFAYDSLGRLASTTDPLDRVESYVYNSANQMTKLVMSNGREVLFGYDANGT